MVAVVVAICILLIMVVSLLSLRNVKDYDERQKLVMNRGSKYALITVLVLNMLFYVLSFEDNFFSFSVMFTSAMSIWSGILVATLYGIWHYAFFSLRAKETSGFAILMIVTGIVNIVLGVIDYLGLWGEGPKIVEGISFGIVGFSWLCMGSTIMLRNHLDSNEEGDL